MSHTSGEPRPVYYTTMPKQECVNLILLALFIIYGDGEVIEEPIKSVYTDNGCADTKFDSLNELSHYLNATIVVPDCNLCVEGNDTVILNETFIAAEVCLQTSRDHIGEVKLGDGSLVHTYLKKLSKFLNRYYYSCDEIYNQENSPSNGYYNIFGSDGSVVNVYCVFDDTLCDGRGGGWMRVGYLDMTQPNTTCPEGLYAYDFEGIDYPLCDKEHAPVDCSSTIFAVDNVAYSRVCGRVRGYQFGAVDGIYDNHGGSPSINADYVDGISITQGDPREHIWTYICGQGDNDTMYEDCPCNTGSTESVLSFVGNNYYCESGHSTGKTGGELYFNDILWDGQQCENLEGPCCTNPNLPWFVRTLSAPKNNDIEVRLCSSEGYPDEATPIDQLELYIQ